MTFESTTTDSDQGNGKVWFNHATPASATVMYVDNQSAGGTAIDGFVQTWDDSTTTSGNQGTIIVTKDSDPTFFHIFTIDQGTTVTDGTGYDKLTVTHVAGNASNFTDADAVHVWFSATGSAGSGLSEVVDDTTPQLGGNLDANSFVITGMDATATASGVVELATDAEVNTGTDTARAVTPANIEAWTGSAQVTTLGTITTGVWQGTAINQTYLTGQSGTNTGDEAAASATVAGVVELATDAETSTGTDTTRAVTPANVASLIGTDVQAFDANNALTDVAQEFTATQNFNETSLTSTSNAVAWAAASNQVVTHTLTENTTFSAPSGLVAGAFYSLKIVQHASAAKTVAYNAVFQAAGGTMPTMTVTTSAVDIMTFRSDGTNMYLVGVVQDLS
jgi:hypothetical protein